MDFSRTFGRKCQFGGKTSIARANGSFIWIMWGSMYIRATMLAFSQTFWVGFCKNSWVKKSEILFWVPSMNSISKSKTKRMACRHAKICFNKMFWTSFSRTCFANLQSILIKNFWFSKSFWDFEMHSTIDKISFLIVL